MRGRRKGFLCPATLLPLLMLAISINLMTTEVEAAKDSNEFADIEDNDFAEFDFDDETDESVGKGGEEEDDDDFETMVDEADDATVEDEADAEDDEFSHFNDDEEFEVGVKIFPYFSGAKIVQKLLEFRGNARDVSEMSLGNAILIYKVACI